MCSIIIKFSNKIIIKCYKDLLVLLVKFSLFYIGIPYNIFAFVCFFKTVAENHISSWATASHDGRRIVCDHISYDENNHGCYGKYMISCFSKRIDNMPYFASQSDLHGACSVFTVSSEMVKFAFKVCIFF